MKTIQTITTIELSSICNLKCDYCIQGQLMRSPNRKPGIMSDDVFDRSLEIVTELISRGTQAEVNLNGNGESLLDPNLPERVNRVKEVVGERQVALCTNGKLLTIELALKLQHADIDRIDLSPHDPYAARQAVDVLRAAQIPGQLNPGPITGSHNWAGQLPAEHQVKYLPKIDCDPLIDGRGYISSEGHISPCCYDFDLKGVIGSVFDKDILEREIKPYSLCETCHQVIPEGLFDEEAAVIGKELCPNCDFDMSDLDALFLPEPFLGQVFCPNCDSWFKVNISPNIATMITEDTIWSFTQENLKEKVHAT